MPGTSDVPGLPLVVLAHIDELALGLRLAGIEGVHIFILPRWRTTVERDEARQRLKRLRDEFSATVTAIQERLAQPERGASGDLAVVDQHPADTATDTAERELDVSRVAMFEARLRQIEDAFARLKQGNYGICIDCGQRIAEERLELLADTPYCVKDAQREQARAQ